MIVLSSSANFSILDFLFPFFRGKNPSNTNWSVGSPEMDRAAIEAVGPGIGVTSISFFRYSKQLAQIYTTLQLWLIEVAMMLGNTEK